MLTTGGVTGVRRRVLAGGVLAVTALLVGAMPSGGQEAPLAEEVSIDDDFGIGGFVERGCDGEEEVYPGFAAVLVSRTAIGGGDLTSDLRVGVTYSGPEADNLIDPPPEIVFAGGDDFGGVAVDLLTPGTGALTVTLEPGPGYVVVEPTAVTIDLSSTEVGQDCSSPLTGDGDADQTIEVGQVPEGFFPPTSNPDLGDGMCIEVELDGGSVLVGYCVSDGPDLFGEWLDTPVVGDLPPGLTYSDDTWSGAATTPGVYPFKVRLCEDLGAFELDDELLEDGIVTDGDDARDEVRDRVAHRSLSRAAVRADEEDLFCIGTLDAEITVVPVTTPPAVPVAAAARFTG